MAALPLSTPVEIKHSGVKRSASSSVAAESVQLALSALSTPPSFRSEDFVSPRPHAAVVHLDRALSLAKPAERHLVLQPERKATAAFFSALDAFCQRWASRMSRRFQSPAQPGAKRSLFLARLSPKEKEYHSGVTDTLNENVALGDLLVRDKDHPFGPCPVLPFSNPRRCADLRALFRVLDSAPWSTPDGDGLKWFRRWFLMQYGYVMAQDFHATCLSIVPLHKRAVIAEHLLNQTLFEDKPVTNPDVKYFNNDVLHRLVRPVAASKGGGGEPAWVRAPERHEIDRRYPNPARADFNAAKAAWEKEVSPPLPRLTERKGEKEVDTPRIYVEEASFLHWIVAGSFKNEDTDTAEDKEDDAEEEEEEDLEHDEKKWGYKRVRFCDNLVLPAPPPVPMNKDEALARTDKGVTHEHLRTPVSTKIKRGFHELGKTHHFCNKLGHTHALHDKMKHAASFWYATNQPGTTAGAAAAASLASTPPS